MTGVQTCALPILNSCKNFFERACPKCIDWQQLLKQYTCQNNSCAPAEATAPPAAEAPAQPAATAPEQPAEQPVQTDTAYNQAYEDEVISLVNAERAKYGLASLSKQTGAAKAAQIRAKEIVQSFSHTRPNGTSCFTVCKELGISYRSAGENIAYGYRTPAQVVNGWMNSEGHRKNILSASFTSIGVGCYQQGGTLYWSQMFLG